MSDTSVTEPQVSAAASRSQSEVIRGFDGLRAIAVLLVVVSHSGYGNIVPGGLGVTIFFAISGFLITRLLLAEIDRTGRLALGAFYVRRFLRLGPELLAFLAVSSVFAWYVGRHFTGVDLLASLFYFMNYYKIITEPGGEGAPMVPGASSMPWEHLWSLSIEEHFYFLWPLALLVALRRRRAALLLGAVLLGPLVWRWAAFGPLGIVQHYGWYNYAATEARLDSIGWGCFAAYLLWRSDGAGKSDAQAFIRPWLAVAGVLGLLLSLLIQGAEFRWVLRFTIQGASLFLIILNLLFDPRWKSLVDVLELWPLRTIGRISYGVYLYHLMAMTAFTGPALPKPASALLIMVTSIAAAAISYRCVEVPLKPLRRRWGSHVR